MLSPFDRKERMGGGLNWSGKCGDKHRHFHSRLCYALPMYLKKDLERVEKPALSIICPGLAYREALKFLDYIANLCKKTFSSIANDPAHRLYSMLPFSGPSGYNRRLKKRFLIPKCRTERLKNSFFSKIMY